MNDGVPEATKVARYRRLMGLFDALCDLPPLEQRHALERVAKESPELVNDLSQMLEADATAALNGGAPDTLGSDEHKFGRLRRQALERITVAVPGASATLEGGLVEGRYRVHARVGEGGAGEVYRATDESSGETVALKFLRAADATRRQLGRFRREFRVIAKMRHPGVVRVFAEGEHQGRRYIAMEWMAGGDFSRFVGAPVTLLLPAFVDIAAALDAIHQKGIVHRDLKPANILLAPTDSATGAGGASVGRAKLADFGIVKVQDPSETGQTSETADGVIVGTIDFLAPEQLGGGPIDARADLYALGCLMYYMVSGRPPFEGTNFERLHRRTTDVAPRLSDAVPTVAPGLDALVAHLLMADPKRRPDSAFAVGTALEGMTEDLHVGDSDTPMASRFASGSQRAFLYDPGCVGRTEELASVKVTANARSDGASVDTPSTILIAGPAGVGKTTVVSAAGAYLRWQGWDVVTVGVHSEQPTPFAPFPELLERMNTGAGVTETGAHKPRFGPYGGGGTRARERWVTQICRQLDQRDTPVALVLEDIHDASHDALLVLQALAQAVADKPVVLLATSRPHGVDAVCRQLPTAKVLVLGALDREATSSVICAMLGIPQGSLDSALADSLARASEGNPLLIVATVTALVHSGGLKRGRDGWTAGPSLSEEAIGEAVSSALLARLDRLSDEARRSLEVAALFGGQIDAHDVAAVAASSLESLEDHFAEGLQAGVLHVRSLKDGGEALRFAHARYVDRLVDGLPLQERRKMHDLAGNQLEAAGASKGAIAYQRVRGTDTDVGIHASTVAAEVALAAFDYSAAERHLRAALGLAEHHGASASRVDGLKEQLADTLVPQGQIADAVALLGDIRGRASERLVVARTLRKTGIAYMRSREAALGLDALRGALGVLDDGIPESRAGQFAHMLKDFFLAALARFWRRWSADPLVEERAYVHRELALLSRWIDLYRSGAHVATFGKLAERLRAPLYRVDAYSFTMFFYAFLGMKKKSEQCQIKGKRLASAADDQAGLMRLELMRGGTELMLHADPETARGHLDEAVAIAHRLADPFLEAFTTLGRGWAALLIADMPTAGADLTLAHRRAQTAGTAWIASDALAGLAIVDLMQARFESAVRRAESILHDDIRLAFPVLEAIATEVVGATALLEGRYHDAVTNLERAMAVYKAHGLRRGWGFLIPLEYVEALCCLVDSFGEAIAPDLDAKIVRSLRWTRTVLGGRALYIGCVDAMKGIRASRRGQIAKARRFFARARAARVGGPRNYFDTWIDVRFALERDRWGDDPASVSLALDAVADDYRRLELAGMTHWLNYERARRGV